MAVKTPQPSDVLGAYAQAQAEAMDVLAKATAQEVAALWRGFTGWYDDAQVGALAFTSGEKIKQAQARVGTLTNSYMSEVTRRSGLSVPRMPQGPSLYPRMDVSPMSVWGRPAETYRYWAAQGEDKDAALGRSLQRVSRMVETDVALARREQSAAYGDRMMNTRGNAAKVTGARRVVHPELSRSGVCGLCLVASTRLYTVTELLPIHTNCRCTIAYVTEDHDPGAQLNQKDLERLYRASGSTSAKDLLNVKVQSFVSGELGPVLTSAGEDAEKDKGDEVKPLAPREKEHEVTGADAAERSVARDKDAQARDLENEIENLRAFIKSNGSNPAVASVVGRMKETLAKREKELRALTR